MTSEWIAMAAQARNAYEAEHHAAETKLGMIKHRDFRKFRRWQEHAD